MNQLSWMIYWAGVADSVEMTLSIIFTLALAASICIAIGCAIWSTEEGWDKNQDGEWSPRSGLIFAARACAATLAFGLVMAFIPSKNTLYGIAASQAGEKVMTSETGVKAMKALNVWLDKQAAK